MTEASAFVGQRETKASFYSAPDARGGENADAGVMGDAVEPPKTKRTRATRTRRQRVARSELSEVRIRHIVKCYRDLSWTRAMRHELATKWGLSYDRMQDLVAEALHRVREEVTNAEEVSVTVGCALNQVLRDSLKVSKRKSISWEERDAAARKVIAAAKVWADIVGASKQRIAVTFEPPVAMSTDKLRSLYGDAMRTLGAHLQSRALDAEAIEAEGEPVLGLPERAGDAEP